MLKPTRVNLYADPVFAEALLGKVTDSIILFWDEILERVGQYVDVVAQGDDVGMLRGVRKFGD
jgi:hypothetical protein